MGDDYESVRLVVKECYVYRIPPRSNARGYRASDWDVNQFLWTGRLRVISQGDKCWLQLEDSKTGDTFATCPYIPAENTVEPVLDSSRYFVLRIQDPGTGKHAFVGMGFPERSWAFDFNVALQDFVNQIRADKAAANAPPPSAGPSKDYSLKEGQTISISLGNITNKSRKKSNANADGSFMLPPPPSSSTSTQPLQQQYQQQPSFNNVFSNQKGAFGSDPFSDGNSPGDDWTDFESAFNPQQSNNNSSNTGSSNTTNWETF
ncbi:hypothetical protein SmJEL517_g03205 [Synchytrium microbalum]|uniref:NECAP PHear domain-containing protein n=1 Tax=Synchytrium microbalum TaxID=1806994 RepID=A0A507C7E0_9FUNG|nr:uncharacterized protein SmJEL517_g03205 [Synchytrium microbalum]TPX33984.1 hypothetical protein SmJEL517_g03205 [Synchytrium microbalum]